MITRADVERLATASGADLAGLLANAVCWLDDLTDAERLDVVKASARLDAWTATVRARAIGAVYDSAEAEIACESAELRAESAAAAARNAAVAGRIQAAGGRSGAGRECTLAGPSHAYDDLRLLHRRIGAEVSLVLGVSSWAADREVDFALDLRARSHLMQALADGRLDRAQAGAILDGAASLTDPINEVRLLTALLGPDDTPEGDYCDPADLLADPGRGSADPGAYAGVAADPEANPEAFWALMQAQQAPPIRELAGRDGPGAELWAIPANRLRGILRREAARLEPAAAAERARAARSERRVVFDDQPDFMSELHVRSTTDAAAAAYANIDQTARAARAAGDPRTLDQLRSDICIGWVTEGAFGTLVTRPARTDDLDATSEAVGQAGGEATGQAVGEAVGQAGGEATGQATGAARSGIPRQRPTAERAGAFARGSICLPRNPGALINVTVAATTATGLDDEPAVLHGPAGPIPMPADLARELAFGPHAGRWRRILYDPRTGVACDVTAGYRAPPRLDAFVRARDGYRSRLPTSLATHLELDHVREFDHACPEAGGRTAASNLASLGQRDHHLKTDRVLRLTGDANGELTITTPSGRSYRSDAHRYADPQCELGDPPF